MKFFGVGIVWDAKKNAPLCTFVDGEFETEDKHVIEQLSKSGYEFEIIENEDEEAILEKALREKAKSLGIKSWHVKSIETLEKEIEETEKGGF